MRARAFPIRLHETEAEQPMSRRMCAELTKALDREQTYELIRLQTLAATTLPVKREPEVFERATLTMVRAYCTGQAMEAITHLTGRTKETVHRTLNRVKAKWKVQGQIAMGREAIRRGVISPAEFLDGSWCV